MKNSIDELLNARKLSRSELSKAARKIIVDEIKENILDYWPYMLFIVSEDGLFIFSNDRAFENLGWKEEELYWKPFIDFVHPDDVEKTLKAFSESNRQTKEELRDRSIFINRYRKKDGSYVVVQWFQGVEKVHGMFMCFAKVIDR